MTTRTMMRIDVPGFFGFGGLSLEVLYPSVRAALGEVDRIKGVVRIWEGDELVYLNKYAGG